MNVYDFEDRVRLLRAQQVQVRERYGFPTFCSILQIERATILDPNLEAFAIAEDLYRAYNYPDTHQALLDCVNHAINVCNNLSIPFPGIFLLRQKQLADHSFIPRRHSAPLFDRERKPS